MLRILYVKAQLFLALILGDSIVVTENQFFDSLGFIETFDELYRAANGTLFRDDLPIRVALRPTNVDVFQAVSKNFENESFVLSLWEKLDADVDRRKRWANSITHKEKPSLDLVLKEELHCLISCGWR